jgi:hypothetical protein
MKNLPVLLLILLTVPACKKNGTGGDATIVAFVAHHEVTPIFGSTVYVKFGARELPNDPRNNYDLKVEGEKDENHVHVEGLRYGDYFLFAVGYDSIIKKEVKGGESVSIGWSERDREKVVHLAVTE